MTGPPGPATGWKSYEEILRLLERLHMDAEGFVYRSSTDYLSRGKPPQRSAAMDDRSTAGGGGPGRRPALCSGNRSDYQCRRDPAARTGSGPQIVVVNRAGTAPAVDGST